MCGKWKRNRRRAFTLTELLLAMAVSGVVLSALLAFTLYAGKSFVALTNYVELEQKSQSALDRMTREVRQARNVSGYTTMYYKGQLITNSISFVDGDGQTLTYAFQENVLKRGKGGVISVVLTNCDFLTFQCFQRNPIAGKYEQYDASTSPTNTKVISVSWICSRSILGTRMNTESVQTAKIVIRKE